MKSVIMPLSKALREGKLSSQELTKEYLKEIEMRNGELNAFISLTPEKALLQAVRDGETAYDKALQNSMQISTGVGVRGKEPLRQMKISTQVLNSFFSWLTKEWSA